MLNRLCAVGMKTRTYVPGAGRGDIYFDHGMSTGPPGGEPSPGLDIY